MGLTSLLTDISSELIFTLVPLFLSDVLGATSTLIGLVGGISDSTDPSSASSAAGSVIRSASANCWR